MPARALNAEEAAARAKDKFLSNMSHEMRTPMNAILGMAAIGKASADVEKKDYAFEKIEDASIHLLGVIDDILDMAKLDAEGKGSIFAFNARLRRAGESAAREGGAGEGEAGAPDDFSKYRVLLADDVELNREIVQSFLEPTGIAIDCAENGEEVVALFRAHPERYDAIFMDLQMPKMDGYEATKRIRALKLPRAKEIPIIALTANVFREDVEKCLASGMNDHLGKPLDPQRVRSKLREYLLAQK
jgi:CheY-like chemotaxis protein